MQNNNKSEPSKDFQISFPSCFFLIIILKSLPILKPLLKSLNQLVNILTSRGFNGILFREN